MDPTALIGPIIAQGGPWALISFVVFLIVTGRLVPRISVDREVSAETRRAEDWKAAALADRARADLRDDQIGEILAFVRRPREGV